VQLTRKLGQLDDIRRNPPRLVFAAQAGWRHCWQTLRDEPTFSELRTKNHRSSPKKFKKNSATTFSIRYWSVD